MTPESINWVKVRAESCSLTHLLAQLEIGAKADVDTINELNRQRVVSPGMRSKVFSVISTHTSRFAVTLDEDQRFNKIPSVEFSIVDKTILISIQGDQANITFTAAPRLNNEGRCVLVVDGSELELWQLRQMALASLFF